MYCLTCDVKLIEKISFLSAKIQKFCEKEYFQTIDEVQNRLVEKQLELIELIKEYSPRLHFTGNGRDRATLKLHTKKGDKIEFNIYEYSELMGKFILI